MSQQINLLRDGLEILELPWSARQAGLLLLAALLLTGLWAGLASWQLQRARTELAALQGQIEQGQAQVLQLGQAVAARQPDPRLPQQIEARRHELAGKRWVIDTLAGKDPFASARFSTYLEALGRQRLDALWLDLILIDAGGAELALRGRTRDPALLPGYLQRLGTESAFSGREFRLFRLDQIASDAAVDRGSLQFSVATRCGGAGLQAVCAGIEREGGR